MHTNITARSVELWAIGQQAAYRLHIPRLYGPIVAERSVVKVNSQRQRVWLLLHKVADNPWPFIKG